MVNTLWHESTYSRTRRQTMAQASARDWLMAVANSDGRMMMKGICAQPPRPSLDFFLRYLTSCQPPIGRTVTEMACGLGRCGCCCGCRGGGVGVGGQPSSQPPSYSKSPEVPRIQEPKLPWRIAIPALSQRFGSCSGSNSGRVGGAPAALKHEMTGSQSFWPPQRSVAEVAMVPV